ncbi:MAG: acylneuraminate cytidylyltransferase family protein, partial [Clostridia bacterium]|nr:acylneuraminate cytidylyltransferase family protein [Clostridia bacterium]
MKNIAIIPARSGSKGIPDKNIRPIAGIPALAYTIKAAIDSNMFETVMVSTDSEQYAEIATKYGADVPFLRSEETSTDTSSSWSVVKEVLTKYEEMGKYFDTIALLQVTSPLRTGNDIVRAFQEMNTKKANAIISMCETDTPLAYCNVLPDDLSLVGFYDDSKYRPRQTRQIAYHANGAIYLYKT